MASQVLQALARGKLLQVKIQRDSGFLTVGRKRDRCFFPASHLAGIVMEDRQEKGGLAVAGGTHEEDPPVTCQGLAQVQGALARPKGRVRYLERNGLLAGSLDDGRGKDALQVSLDPGRLVGAPIRMPQLTRPSCPRPGSLAVLYHSVLWGTT